MARRQVSGWDTVLEKDFNDDDENNDDDNNIDEDNGDDEVYNDNFKNLKKR